MAHDETWNIIQAVFEDVFDEHGSAITPETTPADIEEWDSLRHVTLVTRIEKALGIRFTSSEISSVSSAGAFAEIVRGRQGN